MTAHVQRMLAQLGAVYLFLSGAMVVSGFVVSVRRSRSYEFTDITFALGMAGFIVWAIVLLGVAAWLVSIPFVGAAWLADWLA